MADSHGSHETNPNAAPMHHEIVERFAAVHIWVISLLGIAAAVGGIVAGLLFVND